MKQTFIMPTGEKETRDFPQFKTPWNHDTNFESDRTALYCDDPSLTKQEFKDDVDINVILKRVMTGKDADLPPILPEHFLDVSSRPTFEQMQEKIAETEAVFYTLNPELRYEFQNDPAKWADTVVKAAEKGDGDRLKAIGVTVIETPVEPATGTSARPSTPAAGTEPGAPQGPASGAPKSETPK